MAPKFSCCFLAVLFSISCEIITSLNETCTEKEANRTYNCENLGLHEIPGTLPNSTEFLEFGFNVLPTLQNTTFSRLIYLTFLDLTRCQINWIHEDTFQSHHQLSTLVLTGNPLVFMAATSLDGPQSLKHLFLIQTGISSLEFIPGHNLKDLESLYLGSNYIASIKLPEDFLTRNLKVLDFQNNAIHYLSRKDINSLKPSSNLSLNFKGNDIKGIEPGAFESTVFQSLNFGGTRNLSVVLNGLQNSTIQSLWLGTFEDTEDEDVTLDMLQGLCEISVESIYLQKHHFYDLSPTTFQCFTHLQELDLTATHLKALPSGIEGMNLLKKLVLNGNSFDQLCQINAANFPSLTHLSIKGNRKKLHLGTGCLEKLENLQKLDLSHDDIDATDCCNLQLKNLSHLQSLNLSFNEPLGLQSEAFKACPHLAFLDLAFTHLLVNAPQSPFKGLQLLQALNLSHCLLDTSNQYLLTGLPNLQHLNLEGNHFQDGSISMINPLQTVPNLESLILSYCDLSSIHLQAFKGLGKIYRIDLSHNSLTSSSLEAFSDLKGMYLNLAANNIRIIPPHLLPILSQQNTINLSHNPLDCTCSNVYFLTWYQKNLHKVEDSEKTLCANPPSLMGVKLSDVMLNCGITAVGIFFLILFLLLFAIVLILAIKFLLRWKYQHL
ncbi:CD180 antigen [Dipodomys merriami]|uniref:CD180 antigen n=1 Tax=Dipodomys merriami TaxID=94247 RepID=UPI00385583EE